MTIAAMRGVLQPLQTAATTGNGIVIAIPSSFRQHTVYIKGTDIPSAGAIQLETADSPDYAGTWAPVAGSPVTVPDGEIAINFEGIYQFLRARISTTVASGTVDVNYVGAP